MTKREAVLSALFAVIEGAVGVECRRNAAMPMSLPAVGLVIMRDGEPGQPQWSLSPRTQFYEHRVEIEVLVEQPSSGSGEALLDDLLASIAVALSAADQSLGGVADHLSWSAPETSILVADGTAPVMTARIPVIVEYFVQE